MIEVFQARLLLVNFLEVVKRVCTCSPRKSQLKRCSLRDLLALLRTGQAGLPHQLPVQLSFRVTGLLAMYHVVRRGCNLIISFTHQEG